MTQEKRNKVIKVFTNIEQSKKLAEILPVESADMTWEQVDLITGDTEWEPLLGLDVAIKDNLFSYRNGYMVPCWSLTALLNVLISKDFDPETMFLRSTSDGRGTHLTNVWRLSVDSLDVDITLRDIYADNLVDACVEMILRLDKLKIKELWKQTN